MVSWRSHRAAPCRAENLPSARSCHVPFVIPLRACRRVFHRSRSLAGGRMNTYIWCVVGLIAGGIVMLVGSGKGKVNAIETVTAGMFGAVIGGDLISSALGGA